MKVTQTKEPNMITFQKDLSFYKVAHTNQPNLEFRASETISHARQRDANYIVNTNSFTKTNIRVEIKITKCVVINLLPSLDTPPLSLIFYSAMFHYV